MTKLEEVKAAWEAAEAVSDTADAEACWAAAEAREAEDIAKKLRMAYQAELKDAYNAARDAYDVACNAYRAELMKQKEDSDD